MKGKDTLLFLAAPPAGEEPLIKRSYIANKAIVCE
jgi:hypothetical protein